MSAREIIRTSKFSRLSSRAEKYFWNFSCNLRHWEWLETINNYIFTIKLVIWSLNILGAKYAHMGDFPKLGHKHSYYGIYVQCTVPWAKLYSFIYCTTLTKLYEIYYKWLHRIIYYNSLELFLLAAIHCTNNIKDKIMKKVATVIAL